MPAVDGVRRGPGASSCANGRSRQRGRRPSPRQDCRHAYLFVPVHAKLRQVLREQSIKDHLTSLFNRRHLEEALARRLARAQRTQTPLVVIVAGLDHFKRICDTHGHQAGDAVLRAAAQAMQRQIRASDLACRFGGEPFALLVPDARKRPGNPGRYRSVLSHSG